MLPAVVRWLVTRKRRLRRRLLRRLPRGRRRRHRGARRHGPRPSSFRPDDRRMLSDPSRCWRGRVHRRVPAARRRVRLHLARDRTRGARRRRAGRARALSAERRRHRRGSGRPTGTSGSNAGAERDSRRRRRLPVRGTPEPRKGRDGPDARRGSPQPANAVLLMAGPGHDGPSVERRARRRANSWRATAWARPSAFSGRSPTSRPLLRAADVVIQPSHFEALGPVRRSRRWPRGVPVVASASGGLLDFVIDGENGRLCPPQDPAALAAAIRALVGDGAFGSARPRARARRSWTGPTSEKVFARLRTCSSELAAAACDDANGPARPAPVPRRQRLRDAHGGQRRRCSSSC